MLLVMALLFLLSIFFNAVRTFTYLSNAVTFYNLDFNAFYIGGHILRNSPTNLYDYDYQMELGKHLIPNAFTLTRDRGNITLLPFISTPINGIFYIPFTYLPYEMAFAGALLTNIIILFYAATLLSHELDFKLVPTLLVLLAYRPTWAAIIQTQISPFIFFASCVFIQRS